MFAWAGDVAQEGNDFLAVIDADPRSPNYGRLVATTLTEQQTGQGHDGGARPLIFQRRDAVNGGSRYDSLSDC